MTFIANNHLRWEDKKLYHKDKLLVELVPCKEYSKHWHLKFFWRNAPTPEFFSLVNARENSRTYALQHLNYDANASLREARGEV